MTENLIIIGSGPAGLTAALYAARANLNPVVLGGFNSGGQLMITTDVENYPGFPEGIQGPDLMHKMRQQAERFGSRIIDSDVVAAKLTETPFKLTTDDDAIYETKSIILAMGANAKWLGLSNEKRLQGKGVSACATCDAPLFKNKSVVVVGGGDTAMEEANHLSKFADRVLIVHRRNDYRASKIMLTKAQQNPKISFLSNTQVIDVLGQNHVSGVKFHNNDEYECQGLFLAIGHQPNTAFLQGQIKLDTLGYVVVSNHTKTSVDGVFAAGDVQDKRYRQAITAAGAGCMAALDAERWIEHQR